MQLSSNLSFEQMLTKWSAALNPVLANLIIQGLELNNIALTANTPKTLNHGLSRNQIGFMITDQNAAASIYRTQPYNAHTITIESNADVTINLWNF